MKDLREWDEGDLDRIVQADQKETTTLDYKASAALLFKDKTPLSNGKGTLGEKHRQDMIRDVASMANAEGGLIIYGIAERSGGYPDYIDNGVDTKIVSAEQIEQIILNNINPPVEGFVVHRIDLKSKGKGTCAFVISIPKAHKNAPHQSDDKLYYKRHDATKSAMEDNEIRDMIGRSLEFGRKFGIAWELLVEIGRILAAAESRRRIAPLEWVPRRTLAISVSNSLRTSGVAIMSLPLDLRGKAADLIGDIDEYNSEIETVDWGQKDQARVTDKLRGLLTSIIENGNEICDGLEEVLRDQPG
jgi:Putative DNA-binding domain